MGYAVFLLPAEGDPLSARRDRSISRFYSYRKLRSPWRRQRELRRTPLNKPDGKERLTGNPNEQAKDQHVDWVGTGLPKWVRKTAIARECTWKTAGL